MSETVWARIERARERWNVLRHPFYVRWSAGELSPAELARYSGQYRYAVEAIATLSDAAAAGLPDRPELGRHAAEEHAHLDLWDQFLTACGGDAESSATAETQHCTRAWTAEDGLPSTLIRLYAIESGQPEVSRTKRDGLIDHYGFEDGPATEYFRIHQTRDTEHAAEVRELLDELGDGADRDRLVAAAEGTLRANWRLLDGV